MIFSVINRLLDHLIPPLQWRLPVIILLGVFSGIGLYIVYISNAFSYLSDTPATCVNCHVMNPEYATWQKSSHGRVTNCNDCHVPHNNFISKYLFKAQDGLRHSKVFTLRQEPQVIHIKEAGAAVVQQNCIRCHGFRVQDVSVRNVTYHNHLEGQGMLCWNCHREVPHGRVRGLSSAPYARLPRPGPVMPEWLKTFNSAE